MSFFAFRSVPLSFALYIILFVDLLRNIPGKQLVVSELSLT